MDANFIQERMQDLQSSDEFSNVFSQFVSGGKHGYKTIIEKKPIVYKCKNCGLTLDANQKFCHECGTKIEKPTA